jgi:glycerate-2-kinase
MPDMKIVPNEMGGYRATCDEFPGLVVNGPTYTLCEHRAAEKISEARHSRDIMTTKWEVDAEADDEIIAQAEVAIARKRGRPRKTPEPVLEGGDVDVSIVMVGPVGDE